jgi:trans-aconitate methyltransferase
MELSDYYNSIAEKYHAGAQQLPETVLNAFLSRVPEGGTILDAGCGPGNETHYFRSRGFDATGIDQSEEMIRIARDEHPDGKYEVCAIGDIEPELLFDGVWCSAVLMHFDTVTRHTLIHKHLYPAARHVAGFVVPFGANDENAADCLIPFNKFTEAQLRSELANHEWSVVHVEQVHLKSQWLVALCERINSASARN